MMEDMIGREMDDGDLQRQKVREREVVEMMRQLKEVVGFQPVPSLWAWSEYIMCFIMYLSSGLPDKSLFLYCSEQAK